MDDQQRSARQVLEDHWEQAARGEFDADIERNAADDLVILTRWGVYHGRDGARELARRLEGEVPNAVYTYRTKVVEGDVGLLEWSAKSKHASIDDGADAYVVRNGRIVAQTISYTYTPRRARRGFARRLLPLLTAFGAGYAVWQAIARRRS